jgi:hypothetical protein
MMPFNSFYALREESLKSWEYSISDELMKFLDYGDLEPRGNYVPPQRQVELRIRGRWWEILLRDGNGNFYCCIIEPFLTHTPLHLELGKSTIHRNDSMFITIGKAIQNPEPVCTTFPIRCVIRLKLLNSFSGIIGDICQESLYFLRTAPFFTAQEYREFNVGLPRFVPSAGISIESGQLPGEMVESRTHIVENIACNNTEEDGNRGYFNPVDIGRLVHIEILSTNSERFSVVPIVNGILESLYVFRRPIELTPWPIKWVHMLCSHF